MISLHFSKMHGLGNDFVMVADSELCRLVGQLAPMLANLNAAGPDSAAQINATRPAVQSARAIAARPAGPSTGECHSQSADVDIDQAWLRKFCSKLAALVCNRHFGIGGDGLIVAIDLARLKTGNLPDADKGPLAGEANFWPALEQFTSSYPQRDSCSLAWIYVNSDGSYSTMCGNGLRCFALFASELGWLKDASARVSTEAYPVTVKIRAEAARTAPGGVLVEPAGDFAPKSTTKSASAPRLNGSSVEVIARLAGPKFSPADIPLELSALPAGLTSFVNRPININGLKLEATCLSMGNPHCVIFEQDGLSLTRYVRDLKEAHGAGRALEIFPQNLLTLAADIQQLSLFPEGVNVEFVKIDQDDPDTAHTFIVERGCGATLACASGAAAVLAAGAISGRLNKKSYVILPGGKLEVTLSAVLDPDNKQEAAQSVEEQFIDLTGPAHKVFSGDAALPASSLICESASLKSGEGLCV